MRHIHLFTDGSVNTKTKVGYGAYLALPTLEQQPCTLNALVKLKQFENTSSTKLELQTLLWALNEVVEPNENNISLRIYTDCQNIIGLPNRRARLEENNYYSSKNKRLNNYQLYQAFYKLTEKLNCRFIKVIGHQATHKKNKIDTLFELVDKASRKKLRQSPKIANQ